MVKYQQSHKKMVNCKHKIITELDCDEANRHSLLVCKDCGNTWFYENGEYKLTK